MVYQLRRPVYARWVYAAVLSGALDLPSFEAKATLCARQHSPDHADEIEGRQHQPVTLIEAGDDTSAGIEVRSETRDFVGANGNRRDDDSYDDDSYDDDSYDDDDYDDDHGDDHDDDDDHEDGGDDRDDDRHDDHGDDDSDNGDDD